MPLMTNVKDEKIMMYGNITVDGVPFSRILKLKVWHNAGDHGYAEVAGEMTLDNAKKCMERSDETTQISIKCSNPSTTLFVGGIINIEAEYRHDYARVYIKAATISYQLDLDKKSCSFQNLKKKYMEILKTALEKSSVKVDSTITDKAIEKPVIRYKETDWAFARRMAAPFNAMVFVPIDGTTKQITIGLPKAAKSIDLKTEEYSMTVFNEDYQKFSKNSKDTGNIIQQDFCRITVPSLEYLHVGDKVKLHGKEYYVKNVRAELTTNNYMEMEYDIAGKNGFVGNPPKFSLAGAMFMGQVKEVKEEKVKVHILDIDDQYDSSGDWMFTYATAYASKEESGWYVMPEKDDYVRVIFPSNDTSQAFASSTVNKVPGKKPEDKRFKAPKGKELLFTDKGIFITSSADKVFVNLSDDKGVEISSSKDVNIVSKKDITIYAEKEVKISGSSKVNIGCATSALNVGSSDITVSSGTIALT